MACNTRLALQWRLCSGTGLPFNVGGNLSASTFLLLVLGCSFFR